MNHNLGIQTKNVKKIYQELVQHLNNANPMAGRQKVAHVMEGVIMYAAFRNSKIKIKT